MVKRGGFVGCLKIYRYPWLSIIVEQLERAQSSNKRFGGNGRTNGEGFRQIVKAVVCEDRKISYLRFRPDNVGTYASVDDRHCLDKRNRSQQTKICEPHV